MATNKECAIVPASNGGVIFYQNSMLPNRNPLEELIEQIKKEVKKELLKEIKSELLLANTPVNSLDEYIPIEGYAFKEYFLKKYKIGKTIFHQINKLGYIHKQQLGTHKVYCISHFHEQMKRYLSVKHYPSRPFY